MRSSDPEKAKIEFQRILNHHGEGPLSVLFPLAQLGKARTAKDPGEYEKFFGMWKNADQGLSILVEAPREFDELSL